jgi:hypothetical protein
MTTKEQREVVLQGKDPMVCSIIDYLTARGWAQERILKNVTQKHYSPHDASIWVELESEFQRYWVTARYESEGRNVASTCHAIIDASHSPEQVATALNAFLLTVEKSIGESFAVRFLSKTQDFAGAAVCA